MGMLLEVTHLALLILGPSHVQELLFLWWEMVLCSTVQLWWVAWLRSSPRSAATNHNPLLLPEHLWWPHLAASQLLLWWDHIWRCWGEPSIGDDHR